MNPAASTTIKPPLRSFTQQLDASQMTRTMWLLWALSAGLIALDGFDFFIIGVALPFVSQDFHLGSTEVGAVAVAALVGSLVGSLTLGPITDKVGRQRMLMVDVALFVLATAGTAFAWNALSLIGFRFLVGVAIGADYPISVAYVSENVPSRLRGRMVIGAFTFQAVGALLGALTGWGIIQLFQMLYPDSVQFAIHYAWRWMLGVGLGLAIAIALLRFRCLLESPSYHILRREYEEASQAASMLLNTSITLTPETDPPPQFARVPYTALFSSRYRRQTLLASIPWFLQDIATYGVGIFTPTILGALAFVRMDDFMAREAASAQGAALVDICLIVGFVLAILLVERVGRIQLQIVGFLGMAVGLAILAASGLVSLEPGWAIALVFIGFFIFNLMMNAGPNATTFLLSGEVFPIPIRASGAGFAAAVAKAGAVLGTFELPILKTTLGIPPLMLLLSVCCVLAAALTYQFRIETQPPTPHTESHIKSG